MTTDGTIVYSAGMSDARTVPVHARLSPAVHSALAARAEAERRPVASLIALLIEDAVKPTEAALRALGYAGEVREP